MAWGNNELKFDVDKISELKGKVADVRGDLDEYKNTLKENLDAIKNEWNTPAGRKFMEEYDWDWLPQVDKYINVLEKLEELLGVAEENYRDVEEEASRLDF